MKKGTTTGVKDMLGREIKVGDTIAYPTYNGSATNQNIAVVEAAGRSKPNWQGSTRATLRVRKLKGGFSFSGGKRPSTLRALDRIVSLGLSERAARKVAQANAVSLL